MRLKRLGFATLATLVALGCASIVLFLTRGQSNDAREHPPSTERAAKNFSNRMPPLESIPSHKGLQPKHSPTSPKQVTTASRSAPDYPHKESELAESIHAALIDCKTNLKVLIDLFRERPIECAAEFQRLMDKAVSPLARLQLINAISALAHYGVIKETWPQLLDWGRQGNMEVRTAAMRAMASIHDGIATEYFYIVLSEAPVTTEGKLFFELSLEYASRLHSRNIGNVLSLHANNYQTAVISLAHVGFGADTELLKRISQDSVRPEVRAEATVALEAASILVSERRDERLLEAVKTAPAPDGWFSWPEWALSKIEECQATGLIDRLATLYEDFSKCPHAFPDNEYYKRYWDTLRLKILRTIGRLGGKLSAEQIDMLNTAYLKE